MEEININAEELEPNRLLTVEPPDKSVEGIGTCFAQEPELEAVIEDGKPVIKRKVKYETK